MSLSEHAPFVHEKVYRLVKNVYHDVEPCELEKWFRSPPLYTTVRVNFPRDVEEARIELQLLVDKIYSERGQNSAIVYVHHTLKDLLVIPSPAFHKPETVSKKEVIIDVQCGAAVLRGADIFAPGVLGAPFDLKDGDEVAVYADITGKCLKGFAKIYDGEKLFVDSGVSTCSRQELFGNNARNSGVAVRMKHSVGNCPPLGSDVLGKSLFLQNLPSVICGHVLSPSKTGSVLDMCAAPGGKTTHLASIMQNSGLIVALDRTGPRVAKLKSNITLAGYTNVHAFAFDATKALDMSKSALDNCCLRMGDTEQHLTDSKTGCRTSCSGSVSPPPYAPETFDCILLDAPCSALGQRPQLANRMTEAEVRAFPKLQRKLVSTAVGLLKPGGNLLYSTCSLTLEENEEVVSWTLQKYPKLELDFQSPRIGGPGHSVHGLEPSQLDKLQRFDIRSPGQFEDGDTIGFFIAKFIKSGTSSPRLKKPSS